MFPYFDLPGFKLRRMLPSADIDAWETANPGWILQNCNRSRASCLHSRLRKRAAMSGFVLPFGQLPPTLVAAGTLPPAVSFTGRPVVGTMQMILSITTAGALGASAFTWSRDNGVTTNGPVPTAATVSLAGTGLVANFAAGNYSVDNVYAAETPVPEVVLDWIRVLTTYDLVTLRGPTPQGDRFTDWLESRYQEVLAQVQEAANSDTGLFELPNNEDGAPPANASATLSYSEPDPYTWTDQQASAVTGAFMPPWCDR